MEAKSKFEKLQIWQKAMDIGDEIDLLSEKFPKKEIYNLTSQICRAGDSVALNISEGSILQSNPEQKKLLAMLSAPWLKWLPAFIKPRGEIIFHNQNL